MSGLQDSNLVKLGDTLKIVRPSMQYAFAVSQDISNNKVTAIEDSFDGRFIEMGENTKITQKIHNISIAFERYFVQARIFNYRAMGYGFRGFLIHQSAMRSSRIFGRKIAEVKSKAKLSIK